MKSILKENNQFNFVLVKSGEVSFPPYFLGAKTKKTPRDASFCRRWRDGGVELNEERTRNCLIKKNMGTGCRIFIFIVCHIGFYIKIDVQ